jgi:hypothetical protein
LRDRIPIRSLAAFAGVVFLLVGVLGLVPGVTTHYGELSFAGHGSRAKLLAVFQVSILLDAVHVLFGIAGIALAKTAGGARSFLIGSGVAFLALWLLGIVGAGDWIPSNAADNWLHFVLGVATIGVGFLAGRAPARGPATA